MTTENVYDLLSYGHGEGYYATVVNISNISMTK